MSGSFLLNPVGRAEAEEAGIAPRPDMLDGLTVGLVDNMKVNTDLFLERVEGLLTERYGIRRIVRGKKEGGAFSPAPEALIERMSEECDVVIHAFGD